MEVNQNAKALCVWIAVNPHYGVFPQFVDFGFNMNQNMYLSEYRTFFPYQDRLIVE